MIARCATALLLLLAALALQASPARAGRPGIAYATHVDGAWSIWWMEPSGAGARRITSLEGDVRDPALSPDGRWLACVDRGGRVWVQGLGGEPARRVGLPPGQYAQPCWTPDSRMLIVSCRPDPTREEADLVVTAWPPSGRARANPLTRMPGVEAFPACSPDGQWVVFSHYEVKPDDLRLPRPALVEELYRLEVKTGRIEQLTREGRNATQPCFSPDGRELLFMGNGAGSYDLWALDLEAAPPAAPRRITRHPGYEAHPAWMPDGRRIVFTSDRTGQLEIWSIEPDGSDPRQLTQTPEGRDATQPCAGIAVFAEHPAPREDPDHD